MLGYVVIFCKYFVFDMLVMIGYINECLEVIGLVRVFFHVLVCFSMCCMQPDRLWVHFLKTTLF